MTVLFRHVLAVSLGVGPVLALLAVLRAPLRRRYAARWLCIAWLALALRLLLPYNPSFAFAPLQLHGYTSAGAGQIAKDVHQNGENPSYQYGKNEGVQTAQNGGDAAAPPRAAQVGWSHAALAWALGAAALLAWHGACALWLRHTLRKNGKPCADPAVLRALHRQCEELGIKNPPTVYCCDAAPAPMLAGLFTKTIVLPAASLGGAGMPLVLRHELCHLRRRDIPAKLVLLLATALHWFNPLVWLAARCAAQDIELACDEMCTEGLGAEGKALYGETLLAALRPGRVPSAFLTTSFGGSASFVRKRLEGIFRGLPGRGGAGVVALSLVLTVALGGCVAPAQSAGQPGAQSGGVSSERGETREDTAETSAINIAPEAPGEEATVPLGGAESITIDWAGVKFYEDGDKHPYLAFDFTNNTGKTIIGYQSAMLVYGEDGEALQVYWQSIFEPMTDFGYCNIHEFRDEPGGRYNIKPGKSQGLGGGWSMYDKWDGESHTEIAHVTVTLAKVWFADGSEWENPDFATWMEQYEGVNTQPSELDALYPLTLFITE